MFTVHLRVRNGICASSSIDLSIALGIAVSFTGLLLITVVVIVTIFVEAMIVITASSTDTHILAYLMLCMTQLTACSVSRIHVQETMGVCVCVS